MALCRSRSSICLSILYRSGISWARAALPKCAGSARVADNAQYSSLLVPPQRNSRLAPATQRLWCVGRDRMLRRLWLGPHLRSLLGGLRVDLARGGGFHRLGIARLVGRGMCTGTAFSKEAHAPTLCQIVMVREGVPSTCFSRATDANPWILRPSGRMSAFADGGG